MSVTFVRSGQMMPGKFQQGQQYVQNRINWMKESYGAELSLMVQRTGWTDRDGRRTGKRG